MTSKLHNLEKKDAETNAYLKFVLDLGDLGYCIGDACIRQALTVRSLKEDRQILLELLRLRIRRPDLHLCFNFLLERHNKIGDKDVLISLLKAGVRAQDLSEVAILLS